LCGSFVGGEGHGAVCLRGSFAGGGVNGGTVSTSGLWHAIQHDVAFILEYEVVLGVSKVLYPV
jgi:hypothetical protein